MAKKAAKKKQPKPKKERASKYEEKLKVDATFEELVGVLINPQPVDKNEKPVDKSKERT